MKMLFKLEISLISLVFFPALIAQSQLNPNSVSIMVDASKPLAT